MTEKQMAERMKLTAALREATYRADTSLELARNNLRWSRMNMPAWVSDVLTAQMWAADRHQEYLWAVQNYRAYEKAMVKIRQLMKSI